MFFDILECFLLVPFLVIKLKAKKLPFLELNNQWVFAREFGIIALKPVYVSEKGLEEIKKL